jgi:hypothetical protein
VNCVVLYIVSCRLCCCTYCFVSIVLFCILFCVDYVILFILLCRLCCSIYCFMSSVLFCILFCVDCVVLCIVCVQMCTVLLPPGGNPIAVKYIIYLISYHIISRIISYQIYHVLSYGDRFSYTFSIRYTNSYELVSVPAIIHFYYHNIVSYAYRFMYFRILIF